MSQTTNQTAVYQIQGWKTPEKYNKKTGKKNEPKIIKINEEAINVFIENKEAAQLYYMECVDLINEKNASMSIDQVNALLNKKAVVNTSDDIQDLKNKNKELAENNAALMARLDKLEAFISSGANLTVTDDSDNTDNINTDAELETLRNKYTLLTGDTASKNWKKETITKKIAEYQANEKN